VEQFMRRELITWEEVDRLVDHLVVQFNEEYDAMILITRGGLVPGGMLAEIVGIKNVLTAAVDFPGKIERKETKLLVWPTFNQFPEDELLLGKKVLIVDDVWGSGRKVTAVKNKVSAAGGFPTTCVLHFNSGRSLFGSLKPDYYAASTDVYIVFPWEIDRGSNFVLSDNLN
jgi:uncharacterized protein